LLFICRKHLSMAENINLRLLALANNLFFSCM
jgi:hypothetical protein